jgi:hypothetical protein
MQTPSIPTASEGLEGLSLLVLLHMMVEVRIALGLDTDGSSTIGRAKFLAREHLSRRRRRRGRPRVGNAGMQELLTFARALREASGDIKSTAKPDLY